MSELNNIDKVKLNSFSKERVYGVLVDPIRKHLSSVNSLSLIGLGHSCYAEWLKRDFPNIERLTIFENESIRFLYSDLEKTQDIVYIKDNDWVEAIKNRGEHYDAVVMNPNYGNAIYLKVILAVVEHMMAEKSICSSLSPIGWLQDPMGEVKKRSNIKKYKEILNSLESITPISENIACDLFGIKRGDLGIYVLNKGVKTPFDYKTITKNNSVVEKIRRISLKDNVMLHSSPEGEYARTYIGVWGVVHSHLGDRTKFVSEKSSRWIEKSEKRTAKVINFGSETERNNFFKSLLTPVFRYYASRIKVNRRQPWQFVPWLGNSTHPTTGRVGYLDEWTYDDLCKFFNILPSERMEITREFS